MRVAIYCRVSTSDQSCSRQERDLVDYAHQAGYEVVGIWKETVSGVKSQHQERNKVMELASHRQIEGMRGDGVNSLGA
jgi:DNA invertase Pin-like site-specific DNA recombinase